jgi:hypothetical protein
VGNVDAVRGEQRELLAHGGKARRRARRREIFPRQRLEAHHGALYPAFARDRDGAVEDGLVAEVHAVEIADGKRDRCAAWLEVAQDAHLQPRCAKSRSRIPISRIATK